MQTLLITNILLAVIVLCFIIITILLSIALIYIIGATRKIKHIATVFDDDVIRARSVITAIKDFIIETLFGKGTHKNTHKK
jgi:hypothetical protein